MFLTRYNERVPQNFPWEQFTTERSWIPAIDIQADSGNFIITAELPGVDQQDLEISIEGDSLLIKGEKKLNRTEANDGFLMTERHAGAFQRSFHLGDKVDREEISASFKDGVLVITLKKNETSRKKLVEIKG
ncbi:MAG: Hsp20/alpha crystallin family protein [Candidatus Delongbacteria bacterium]|nr:Hsp20/alpha crystallin family protein [Candidatus Delongbacteria bacterium]